MPLTAERPTVETPLERELSPEVQERLLAYPGKWVALTPDEILAVADDPGTAYREAQDKGVASPILYQVPDTRAGYSYF